MNRRLTIRAEAEADIAESAMWYESRESGLGNEFVNEVRDAIRRISARPLSYLRIRKDPAVHRSLVRRFPYRVFFILRIDAIVVFAILHGARHDRHWRKRARGTV